MPGPWPASSKNGNNDAATIVDMATSSPANPLTPPPGAAATNTSDSLVLHDIKPPLPIFSPWPYFVAALLLALGTALLLAWLLQRRRRHRQTTPRSPTSMIPRPS